MIELVIRPCERSDLRSLEWSPHLRPDPLTGAALGFDLEILRWPLARRGGIVARPW